MEQDLIARFADLTDDALLQRLHSGSLTEEAQSIARAEALRRGLDLNFEPAPMPEKADLPPADYVQLSRYMAPLEAYLLEGRLQAEGVAAHLCGVKTIETDPFLWNAMGGVRMFVPRQQFQRACEILADIEAGKYDVEEETLVSRRSDIDVVKRRFGWMVILAGTLFIEIQLFFLLWAGQCRSHGDCGPAPLSSGVNSLQLFILMLGLTPAIFASIYMRLRFKRRFA
jgi:hypothetical protein